MLLSDQLFRRVADRSVLAGAVLVGLLGVNLRPTVTSVGAELSAIGAAPGATVTICAVLVAVPVWCFAAGSSLGWALRARWGLHQVITGALAVLAVSLLLRSVAGPALLLVGTVAAGLAIAVLAALLPVAVQAGSPRSRLARGVAMTGALGVGSSVGALLTPVLASQFGWRPAIASWAVPVVVALLCWRAVGSAVVDDAPGRWARRVSPAALVPRRRAVLLAVHFGALSGVTFALMGWLPDILFTGAGVGRPAAGLMFSAVMVVGIPVSFLAPVLARRTSDRTVLIAVLAAAMGAGVIGLLVAPGLAPWLWVVLLGVGMGGVAVVLTLITTCAGGDRDVGAALSSLVQGAGYAIAGVIALLVGLVHAASMGWQWPLVTLVGVVVVQSITGIAAGRPVVITAVQSDTTPQPSSR